MMEMEGVTVGGALRVLYRRYDFGNGWGGTEHPEMVCPEFWQTCCDFGSDTDEVTSCTPTPGPADAACYANNCCGFPTPSSGEAPECAVSMNSCECSWWDYEDDYYVYCEGLGTTGGSCHCEIY